ncbi:hypothetical protein BDZ97DRAFT_1925035 [Flammula alnicola]|nr:hypothetical protein BDZ97DRAFT_1925035 [Flammula alnicola]
MHRTVEPNSMSQEPGELVTTTVRDYDLLFPPAALRVHRRHRNGRHLHLLRIHPIGIKNLYDPKPVVIHILGQPSGGDLKHPFKTESMFGPAAGPQTDATATAEAEGEKRVGKKED